MSRKQKQLCPDIGELFHVIVNTHNLYFDGVGKIVHSNIMEDDYHYVEIVNVFKTNTKQWKCGWTFYLDNESLVKKINEDDYPEYFI